MRVERMKAVAAVTSVVATTALLVCCGHDSGADTSAPGGTSDAGHCSFAPNDAGANGYPGLWLEVGCVVAPSPCPGSQVCCPTGCLHVCDALGPENMRVCVSGTTCAEASACPIDARLPWLGPDAGR